LSASPHLSDQQRADYLAGQLAADLLLALDDHLANCGACRARLRGPMLRSTAFAALGSAHLDFPAIEALVDGRLGETDRARYDSHLAICQSCAADVEDLREFRRGLATVPPPVEAHKPAVRKTWSGFWRPWRLALLASGLAVAALFFMLRTPRISGPILVAYNDGGGRIVLDDRGNLREPAGWAAEDRSLVEETLRRGRVEVAASAASGPGGPEPLRGAKSATLLVLQSPLGVAVFEQKPTLRWSAVENARSYEAAVYDPGFHRVATSGKLNATEWTVTAELQRGGTFYWEVTAQTAKGELRAPGVGAPAAQFAVLAENPAAELERLQRAYPNAHLLLGLRFAKAGVADRARTELEAFAAANPQSDSARALIDSLR
jgi:hypothetical protein